MRDGGAEAGTEDETEVGEDLLAARREGAMGWFAGAQVADSRNERGREGAL